jgi:hypothetical protein
MCTTGAQTGQPNQARDRTLVSCGPCVTRPALSPVRPRDGMPPPPDTRQTLCSFHFRPTERSRSPLFVGCCCCCCCDISPPPSACSRPLLTRALTHLGEHPAVRARVLGAGHAHRRSLHPRRPLLLPTPFPGTTHHPPLSLPSNSGRFSARKRRRTKKGMKRAGKRERSSFFARS